jgi:uncharacterized protein (TIGR02217 family)
MFYSIQIAAVPGFGWTGTPEFSTNIQKLANGREKRNGDWAVVRHTYSPAYKNISIAAYLAIKDVFLVMRGSLHTFLHKDWADYSATNAQFDTADGVKTVYQLAKISALGGGTYTRIITKPAAGVIIYVNGVATTAVVSQLDGSVTFASPPAEGAVLSWTGNFFIQVRFDADTMPFTIDDKNSTGFFTNGTLDLIEVLDE